MVLGELPLLQLDAIDHGARVVLGGLDGIDQFLLHREGVHHQALHFLGFVTLQHVAYLVGQGEVGLALVLGGVEQALVEVQVAAGQGESVAPVGLHDEQLEAVVVGLVDAGEDVGKHLVRRRVVLLAELAGARQQVGALVVLALGVHFLGCHGHPVELLGGQLGRVGEAAASGRRGRFSAEHAGQLAGDALQALLDAEHGHRGDVVGESIGLHQVRAVLVEHHRRSRREVGDFLHLHVATAAAAQWVGNRSAVAGGQQRDAGQRPAGC
ncbi:hypothetical protein D3C81_1157040 [compost metagenome]